jgi:hypothetical protein
MQFVKGKPPETQDATRPGARAKRREVALCRPGFEPGRIARMAEFKAIPRPVQYRKRWRMLPGYVSRKFRTRLVLKYCHVTCTVLMHGTSFVPAAIGSS